MPDPQQFVQLVQNEQPQYPEPIYVADGDNRVNEPDVEEEKQLDLDNDVVQRGEEPIDLTQPEDDWREDQRQRSRDRQKLREMSARRKTMGIRGRGLTPQTSSDDQDRT